jgi:hypothetical protein
MCNPRLEIGKYGQKRLKSIARFLVFGGMGYESLFEGSRWYIALDPETMDKATLIKSIIECGAFQHIEQRFQGSWERLLVALVTSNEFLGGLHRLMGMEVSFRKIDKSITAIHSIVNRLSIIYQFPGDPDHPLSRKRINDVRLNALFKKDLFGKDPLTVAKNIESFQETLLDPYMRNIFWSYYTPGTGLFKISMNDLEQVVDSEDLCPICMDEFCFSTPGIHLSPCMHVFHPRCIQHLILNLGSTMILTCPLCRQPVIDIVAQGT